jgi:hypothetical protein
VDLTAVARATTILRAGVVVVAIDGCIRAAHRWIAVIVRTYVVVIAGNRCMRADLGKAQVTAEARGIGCALVVPCHIAAERVGRTHRRLTSRIIASRREGVAHTAVAQPRRIAAILRAGVVVVAVQLLVLANGNTLCAPKDGKDGTVGRPAEITAIRVVSTHCVLTLDAVTAGLIVWETAVAVAVRPTTVLRAGVVVVAIAFHTTKGARLSIGQRRATDHSRNGNG